MSFEPNDTMSNAADLTAGSFDISGHGHDWFRIQASPGMMNFFMSPTASQNLNMVLYDANGAAVAQNLDASGPFGPESFSYFSQGRDVYYLHIYNAAAPDTGDNLYHLDIALPTTIWPAPAYEPNDSMATAAPLTNGTQRITGMGEDWFRVDANPGPMTFSVTPAPGTNVNMGVYNAAGQLIAQNLDPNGASSTESVTLNAPDAGVYYIRVYSPGGRPTQCYDLSVATSNTGWTPSPYEPNNSMATAAPIGAGSHQIAGRGQDWYQVRPRPGAMTFSMTGVAGQDVNMVLYDSSGRQLASNFGPAGTTETITYVASGVDTYYIQIYSANNPDGGTPFYTLDVALPTTGWATELNFGPINYGAVATYDIDNDGVDEIFVGANKYLGPNGEEIRPGGLICLNADGTVRWTLVLPGAPGADAQTGQVYSSSSVTTAPVFADVDGDGVIDILVGTGGDPRNNATQGGGRPGDYGALYAISATGQIKWSHVNRDAGGDGRPDGISGSPTVFDLNNDSVRDVVYSSWDHWTYILDGRTGAVEQETSFLDTIASTPLVADLNGDGVYEIVVNSDITANAAYGLSTGGIVHVIEPYMMSCVPGWTTQVGTTRLPVLRGYFEEQVLWSSPQIADLAGDGTLQIVYGTGNFFQDGRGEYVRVRNADGSVRYTLTSHGRVNSAPLVADIDGDGRQEIVAATLDGYVEAWNWRGERIFSTQVHTFGDGGVSQPIFTAPLAVDLNGDGRMEIIVASGSQVSILNSSGQQVNDPTLRERLTNGSPNTPVVRDVNRDGLIDIVFGGSNEARDRAVVYSWSNPFGTTGATGAARDQSVGSNGRVRDFVTRFYENILSRAPDAGGLNRWTEMLGAGVRSGADVASGFINSAEFRNLGLSDAAFVDILYRTFFNRAPDAGGRAGWLARLAAGADRQTVLDGFVRSAEFANLCRTYGIRAVASNGPDAGPGDNVILGAAEGGYLRGGAGNDQIYGAGSAPTDPNLRFINERVYRLYGAILGREADAGGLNGWSAVISNRSWTIEQVADAMMGSAEFQTRFGSLDDTAFVTLLYNSVLGRAPDAGGLAYWTGRLQAGVARRAIVLGFSESAEYIASSHRPMIDYFRNNESNYRDVIEGGAGDDVMAGKVGANIYVFRAEEVGSDLILGFKPWDQLQISHFGYRSAADAIAHMTQQGADVVFQDRGQTIRFANFTLAEMRDVRFIVS